MIAYNCSLNDLNQALLTINKEYDNNIKFKRLDNRHTKRQESFIFTLTVKNSSKAGARFDHINNRRIAAACWHVHGRFFDILLSIKPDCYIQTSVNGGKLKIYNNNGNIINNWQDWNIGSAYYPMNYSQACLCS